MGGIPIRSESAQVSPAFTAREQIHICEINVCNTKLVGLSHRNH